MKRIICIGKWIKGKKSVVIDLGAYKEAKRNKKQISEGRSSCLPACWRANMGRSNSSAAPKKQTTHKLGTHPQDGESKRSADKRKRRRLRPKYKPPTRRYPWEFF